MHPTSRFAQYQKTGDATPIDMLARYELSLDQCVTIVNAIRQSGMIPLATPFSLSDIQTLAALNLPAIKIASPDIANPLLLLKAASLGKPLILSTGAASIEETADAVALLKPTGLPIALLHCVSAYPTPPESANLGWIAELSKRFDCPVGFSDHTQETIAGALATSAGACIVEKHLTWDRNATGPDHAASADPNQFAYYVKMIRLAEKLLGQGAKTVLPGEQDVRQVSRQSLVATKDLPAGHVIVMEDLTTQRPGDKIPAARFSELLGLTLSIPIPKGEFLPVGLIQRAGHNVE